MCVRRLGSRGTAAAAAHAAEQQLLQHSRCSTEQQLTGSGQTGSCTGTPFDPLRHIGPGHVPKQGTIGLASCPGVPHMCAVVNVLTVG